MIQPLGAILAGLAIWLYACDRSNEFMPWVGAGLGLRCCSSPSYSTLFRNELHQPGGVR